MTQNYQVAIPYLVTQTNALKICRNLGKGVITSAASQDELNMFVSWFKTNTGDACKLIWTPLTDQQEEGIWRNVHSGEIVDFLPLGSGQGKDGSNVNHMIIKLSKMPTPYEDVTEGKLSCFSCSLERSSSLILWGTCQDSYLGKVYC